MTQCQRCHGRAQTFLCGTCERELREMLVGLTRGQKLPSGHRSAGWLEYLEDATLGRTRLGESARRSTDRTTPLMVHLEASKLLDQVHCTLIRWVQDICETRGVECPIIRTVPRDFIGPLRPDEVRGHAGSQTRSAAVWLARNVSAIACDESAGMCWSEVKHCIDEIERMINRAIPLRYCGPCPTMLDDESQCGVGVYAKHDEPEVKCWKCKRTHDANELIKAGLAQAPGELYTAAEILDVMAGIGMPIKERIWRHWRATGKIEARNEWAGEPRYWLHEVVELHNRNSERVARIAS